MKAAGIHNLEMGENPLQHFRRIASGGRITPPGHIFFWLGESHAQAGLDELYADLHLMGASKDFRADPHTVVLDNFLSAGSTSRPSLVSLLTDIYDANMELNEREMFWKKTVECTLPREMKRLGYRSDFWYGGGLNHGSMQHFVPRTGFDVCHAGPDFCGKDAPATWLGVYDHIFLEKAAEIIEKEDSESAFHFLYTTSNHGPWKLPFAEYGFDADELMPDIPESLKHDKRMMRRLAAAWYADRELMRFVRRMREAFPDSLFIVTGDHTTGLIPYQYGLTARREPSLREQYLTTFAMQHPELSQDMLAGNIIGGHMNILPTLIELIAPKGHEYISLFPALTEKIDQVVTPACWMIEERIGYYGGVSQSLAVSGEMLPVVRGENLFVKERDAYCELTAWLVRHPERLVE